MELCSLTDAARQNIAQTYIGLARELPDTRVIDHPNFVGTISLRPYSFCNFILGFNGEEADLELITAEVDRWARLQPAMRIFIISGDEPRGLTEAMLGAEFAPLHRMVQMVWFPARTLGREEWHECAGPEFRHEVSEFMVKQFFSMNEAGFRQLVVDAAASGTHELWYISENDSIIAAAMVAPSPHALGIYNVCVDSSKRRRGYGSSLMRSAQLHAFERGTPLVLQCDEKLSSWYRELGFQVFGEMQSFQRRI